MCVVCASKKAEKYRSSEGFIEWQKNYQKTENRVRKNFEGSKKLKRLLFEFTLNKQLLGVEQCQDKLTQVTQQSEIS